MTENMKNLDEEIAQQIKNDHIKKMVFTARNYSLEDVETIVCGNLNTIAYEYEKALTAQRQSWEREKAVLEDKLSHALYQSESWMKSNAGQCARADKAEAEKKGLEEKVRELTTENGQLKAQTGRH